MNDSENETSITGQKKLAMAAICWGVGARVPGASTSSSPVAMSHGPARMKHPGRLGTTIPGQWKACGISLLFHTETIFVLQQRYLTMLSCIILNVFSKSIATSEFLPSIHSKIALRKQRNVV